MICGDLEVEVENFMPFKVSKIQKTEYGLDTLLFLETDGEIKLKTKVDYEDKMKNIESLKDFIGNDHNKDMETNPGFEIETISGDYIGDMIESVENELVNTGEYKQMMERDQLKLLTNHFQITNSVKESLLRLLDSIDQQPKTDCVVDRKEETDKQIEMELGEELNTFWVETNEILNLVTMMELKLSEYKVMRENEKRELESSVVSLTEENRDINTLLRVALMEKETVERSLNRLKGNNEPKRGAIWGLPRVGFGFMIGANEQAPDNSSAKSDSSECDEEIESLASTVEKMMKNLRLDMTQLRKSLEESRSENERLRSLTEKQAHVISQKALYIKEMENKEARLASNVEELLTEIKETEEEVVRWREACELEVQAGKGVVEERDKLVLILKQELEKTRAALEIANGKLKLKEDLANAAMAAQAAGERSLQLTDRRVSVLNHRVEELIKQLEAAENQENIRHKVRHICWPFRAIKANTRNAGVRNFKRMLPEMQALLN